MSRIEWVRENMSVLNRMSDTLKKGFPFSGAKIGVCLHIEYKTACLAITLRESGADIYVAASNPLSTKDGAVRELLNRGINVFARGGEDIGEYRENIEKVLDNKPDLIIDDGGDMGIAAHHRGLQIRGVSEETTTGTNRYRAMEARGELTFPVIDTNGAGCKHLFDNRFGTGQSALEGIMRSTNISISGKRFVVCGFGDVGRGIALRAAGLGANVIVSETDPIRALEAYMEGYMVLPIESASRVGDIFITATGNINAIDIENIREMRSGAILANAGHFDVEIDRRINEYEHEEVDRCIDRYQIDGKSIYLLGKGRLVNLVCADGHPIEVMDMSFSLQALAARYLLEAELEPRVYPYPHELDELVASLKLSSAGLRITSLTEEQKLYMGGYKSENE